MKTLIVTASSKSKRSEGEIPFNLLKKTFVNSIDEKNKKLFLKARNNLFSELKFDKGPDTNSDMKSTGKPLFLPAYIRYAGRTYSKITDKAWETINDHPENFDCIILSALYGLARYNEPLRNYTIKQVTKLPSGQAIGKYWKEQGAQDWLFSYIKNNDIDNVKFVLSTSYSDIVGKEKLMERLEEELGINSEDQQFKQGGMKSMLLRGQYINNLLLNQL
ncbi:MAG: peroxide stress protein YaaA [Candidatus Hodarchaeales archaeon]|jgi:cytoplasmic iron level regulating protein YaaA (DUF328/UPF0246 family)